MKLVSMNGSKREPLLSKQSIYPAESIVEAKVEKEPGSRRAKAPKLIWVRLPNPLHYKSKWVL